MANLMTDQWLGTLLGARQSPRGVSDEDLLSVLTETGGAPPVAADPRPEPVEPPPVPAPAPAAPRGDVLSQVYQPARPATRSRVDSLMSTLTRPTQRDLDVAALTDAFLGGSKNTDRVYGRADKFDSAMLGAQEADLASAARGDAAERDAGLERERMALTQRGQNLADKRAEEQRKLTQFLLDQKIGAQGNLQTQRDAAALERAKINARRPLAGGAAPVSPEEQAKDDAAFAAWLMQQANVPRAQAEAYVAGNIDTLPKEVQDKLWAASAQFGSLDKAEQQRVIKARLSSEGNTPDSTAAAIEKKKLDPKERLKLKDEVSSVGQDIGLAKQAWAKMSDTAKQVFVKYAGAGGDIAQTIKSAVLSPEDQKYSGQLQSLANALIKARSGSAVTGSEWNRVAQEIGWPTGDFSLFNTTAGVDGWLDKSKRAWVNRVKNIKSEYGDIWSGDGGQ
jgi:plasmid stability protein